MTRRAALLCGAAVAAPVAWTVAASAAALWWMGLWSAFPYPSTQWFEYLPYHDQDPRVAKGLLFGAGAATAVLFAAGNTLRGTLFPKPPLHGKSAYAKREEAEKAGIVYSRKPRSDSILLGRTRGFMGFGRRYLNLPGTDHAALYARTGAGKGVSYVVPACLAWQGSLVAFDIKGELYRLTAGRRQALEQETFFFAPTAPDGKSHRYNPFSVVPRGQTGCIDALHRIMNILVPTPPRADVPFWPDSARALGSAGAVILAETPGQALNLASVLDMFTRPDHKAFIHGLVNRARQDGKPLPRSAVNTVLSWVESDDPKTREGIVGELKSRLSLYASPQIAAATETSDFDLREIRKRGMSIYVGVGPADLRRLRPLVSLLFQQLIDVNTQTLFKQDAANTHNVLIQLDEFAAAGPMTMLADAAAFVREYGLRMSYVLQTKSQAVSIYGPEGAENLFENTGAEVVFGLKGMKLAREVSEMAGMDTVTDTSRSRPRLSFLDFAKHTESDASRRRALLLPQEVTRLPADEQLVFRPGMMALRTSRIRYYRDRWFKRLVVDPPPVPALNVRIERDAGKAHVKPAAKGPAPFAISVQLPGYALGATQASQSP